MEICFVCTAKSRVIVLYFFVVHLAITAILLYINGIYSYPPWQKYCRFNCCLYYHSVILYLTTSRCHKLNIWDNDVIVLGITENFIFIVFRAILVYFRKVFYNNFMQLDTAWVKCWIDARVFMFSVEINVSFFSCSCIFWNWKSRSNKCKLHLITHFINANYNILTTSHDQWVVYYLSSQRIRICVCCTSLIVHVANAHWICRIMALSSR